MGYVSSDKTFLVALERRLVRQQRPQGGWPFLAGSRQTALEPTCLALLALRLDPNTKAQVVLDAQRPDGSWGAFAADDGPSGLTGLALLTLNSFGTFPEAANHADFRLRLDAMLERLEGQIGTAVAGADRASNSTPENENSISLLGAFRGVSEELVNFARQSDGIDWVRLRDSRF